MFARPVPIYRTSTQNQYGLFWQNSIKIKSNNAMQGKAKKKKKQTDKTLKKQRLPLHPMKNAPVVVALWLTVDCGLGGLVH